jgi:hypothetical protein
MGLRKEASQLAEGQSNAMKRSMDAAEPNGDVHGLEATLESAGVQFIDTPQIGRKSFARMLRKASKDDKIDITRIDERNFGTTGSAQAANSRHEDFGHEYKAI